MGWTKVAINDGLIHINRSPQSVARAAVALRLLAFLAFLLSTLSVDLSAATKKKSGLNDTVGSGSPAGRGTRRKLVATRHSTRSRRHGRHQSEYQRRMTKVHLEPQRVQEIQRALSQAGYLHREANGLWDADTRAAMERYQQDNGFSLTGLPDARSLMKLGLGPHPLPSAADPKTTADSILSNRPTTSSPGPGQPPN
jgi:hypothetical protein